MDIDTVNGGNHVLRTTGFGFVIQPSTCSDHIKGIDAGEGVYASPNSPSIDAGDICVQYQGAFKNQKQYLALRKKGQFDSVRCEVSNQRDIVTCSSVVPSSDFPTGLHTHCVEVGKGLYLDGRPDPVFPVSLGHVVSSCGRFSGYHNNICTCVSSQAINWRPGRRGCHPASMVNDGIPSGKPNNVEMIVIPQDEIHLYPNLMPVARLNETKFKKLNLPHVFYRATQPIAPGEELLVSYTSAYWNDPLLCRCLYNVLEAFPNRIDFTTDVVHPSGDIAPDTRRYMIRVFGFPPEKFVGDRNTYTLAELNTAQQLHLVAICESAATSTKAFSEALTNAIDPESNSCSPDDLAELCENEIARAAKASKRKRKKGAGGNKLKRRAIINQHDDMDLGIPRPDGNWHEVEETRGANWTFRGLCNFRDKKSFFEGYPSIRTGDETCKKFSVAGVQCFDDNDEPANAWIAVYAVGLHVRPKGKKATKVLIGVTLQDGPPVIVMYPFHEVTHHKSGLSVGVDAVQLFTDSEFLAFVQHLPKAMSKTQTRFNKLKKAKLSTPKPRRLPAKLHTPLSSDPVPGSDALGGGSSADREVTRLHELMALKDKQLRDAERKVPAAQSKDAMDGSTEQDPELTRLHELVASKDKQLRDAERAVAATRLKDAMDRSTEQDERAKADRERSDKLYASRAKEDREVFAERMKEEKERQKEDRVRSDQREAEQRQDRKDAAASSAASQKLLIDSANRISTENFTAAVVQLQGSNHQRLFQQQPYQQLYQPQHNQQQFQQQYQHQHQYQQHQQQQLYLPAPVTHPQQHPLLQYTQPQQQHEQAQHQQQQDHQPQQRQQQQQRYLPAPAPPPQQHQQHQHPQQQYQQQLYLSAVATHPQQQPQLQYHPSPSYNVSIVNPPPPGQVTDPPQLQHQQQQMHPQ
jgi:hypothetical protein